MLAPSAFFSARSVSSLIGAAGVGHRARHRWLRVCDTMSKMTSPDRERERETPLGVGTPALNQEKGEEILGAKKKKGPDPALRYLFFLPTVVVVVAGFLLSLSIDTEAWVRVRQEGHGFERSVGGRQQRWRAPRLCCSLPLLFFDNVKHYMALGLLLLPLPPSLLLLASQARSDDEWRTIWGGTGVP